MGILLLPETVFRSAMIRALSSASLRLSSASACIFAMTLVVTSTSVPAMKLLKLFFRVSGSALRGT